MADHDELARARDITGDYRDHWYNAEQIAWAEDGMTVEQAQRQLNLLAEYEAAISPASYADDRRWNHTDAHAAEATADAEAM